MKKTSLAIIALCLCACLLGGLMSISALAEYGVTSGTCGTDATWKIDESTGTLTIAGTGAMFDYEYLAPNGKGSAPWADYNYAIKKISIGTGITHIGSFAFAGTYATAITIPSGVTSIGEGAFVYNDSMESVSVASGNSSFVVANNILYNKAKTELIYCPVEHADTVTIPSSVTTIAPFAFAHCMDMNSLTIPNSVKTIGSCAFLFCNLSDITIPSSVTKIGAGAFTSNNWGTLSVASGNTAYVAINNVIYNKAKTELVCSANYWESTFVIPATVKVIDDYALYYYNLSSITLPSGLTQIGKYAFSCSYINSVSLPASLKSIDTGAFSYCMSLESVSFQEGLESIGDCAFSDCYVLNDISLPSTLTSLGTSSFAYCDEVKSITIPGSVKVVPQRAFYWASLESITIEPGVTVIEDYAFGSMNTLKTLTLPSSITTIKEYAFNFNSITNVYYSGNQIQWGDINIDKSNYEFEDATLHYSGPLVPLGDVNADGRVSLKDVALLYNACTEKATLSAVGKAVADMNEDGKITLADVSAIYHRIIL